MQTKVISLMSLFLTILSLCLPIPGKKNCLPSHETLKDKQITETI